MVGHIKDEFARAPAHQPLARREDPRGGAGEAGQGGHPGGLPAALDRFQRAWTSARTTTSATTSALAAFSLQRDLAKVGRPVVAGALCRPSCTPAPIAVNAAYDPQINGIDITAAIVQPPFYKPGADIAVNYCTMGAVIGHELTHGFDSNGRQYDATGNVRDWWTPKAAADFKKRTDLLVAEVNQFALLPGLKQDGAPHPHREHRRPGRHHPRPMQRCCAR